MADLTVTIEEDGTPDPEDLGLLNEGDTVTFVSDDADAVVCMGDAGIFGGSRYEIPSGSEVELTVQPQTGTSSFAFYITVDDLNADCDGHLGAGGEGGGQAGGGS